MKLLGNESKNFSAKPSDRIYFGRYPYRIKLNFKYDIDPAVEKAMENFELPDNAHEFLRGSSTDEDMWIAGYIDLVKNQKIYGALQLRKDIVQTIDLYANLRFYTDYYSRAITVYCKDKEFYSKVLRKLPNNVEQCSGPWSTKHKKLLQDKKIDVAVRKKPFWNKYNIKVSARPTKVTYDKRRKKIEEIKHFFEDNIDPKNIRFRRRAWWDCVFYTNEKEIDNLKTFLALAHPNTDLQITKCFIIK